MTKRTLVEHMELIEDINTNGNGIDAEVLREAVDLTEQDFGPAMTLDQLLASLRQDGLL
jgi:hypothetical protein